MKKKLIPVIIIIISGLLLSQCAPGEDGPKGLGLGKTPEMLYKSFRASSAQAHEGAAPETAKDVDLSPLFPKPGNQGTIGSCTAWTTAYACKTYQENVEREWGLGSNSHIFSPSYIYNQINNGTDGGAPLEYALMLVIDDGCASLETMPYTLDYRQKPNSDAVREARGYRARSFARVDPKNLSAVKEMLSRGMPVLIGMLLYENFQVYSGGVYSSIDGPRIGGHAMCVIGYDDGKKAFKVINSWGTSWGEQGYVWIGYDVFTEFVQVCLVLYDEITESPVVPAVAVNLEASRGSYKDRIEVTWGKAANAESYIVYRSLKPNEAFTEIAKTRGTRYMDSRGIKKGTEYYYAVKSIGRSKESALSESAKGYAGSIEKEVGIPQKCEGLFDEGTIYLKWQAITGVSGYVIYRFDTVKETYLKIGLSKNPNFRDAGTFKPGSTIWYTVTAVRDTTEGRPGEALAVFVPFPEKKEIKTFKAPGKVAASQGTHPDKITVTWESVPDAPQYIVYKYKEADASWNPAAETTEPRYTDSSPQAVTEYYAVAVKDGDTIGERSEAASGFVTANKPKEEKFDDEKYYDDREIADTDYKDDDLYVDDVKEDKPVPVDDSFFDDKKKTDAFFDPDGEKETFFDSKEDQEKFFDSKEDQEEFFDSKEEQDKFFDSDKEKDDFFD